MDVGAILLFAIPIAITIVLAFIFLAKRDDIVRALCIIFQLFAFTLLYSMHQYLLSQQIEPFLGLMASWTDLFITVVLFIELIAWVIEKL